MGLGRYFSHRQILLGRAGGQAAFSNQHEAGTGNESETAYNQQSAPSC